MERWEDLQAALFDGRITERAADSAVALALSRRATDAAAVPVSITISPELVPRLRALWLVVDENPAPLAIHAEPGPAGALQSLSTVLRVDAHTPVHAVAETQEGRLLEAAETEAIARGCHGAWIDTFNPQALRAYQRQGYAIFGELPEFPIGRSRYFLQKKLSPR